MPLITHRSLPSDPFMEPIDLMIHHSEQKHVSGNTTDTEIPHISLDRYLELQAENRLLRQEISRLAQHNEVLHNCWQHEKQRYLYAAGVIRELENHLNPPGEVA